MIGFPLFLLLEPLILNRWFNFIRIKPLLDQFQGCYNDKHRWFASYYLICRQVIILIVYFGNMDYNYEMLYYLQTTCVLITIFHMWIQPYTNDFLNAFDGVILLALVLMVNINTFSFLPSATSIIIIILILFPVIALCLAGSRRLISQCMLSRRHQNYDLIDYVHSNDDDNVDWNNNVNTRR